ncbi:MAG: hypothetical protein EHM28_13770, partial [Spirochaetaceae bacterium]
MNMKRIILVLLAMLAGITLYAQPIDRPVAIIKFSESEVISQSQFRQTVETLEKQYNRKLTIEEKKTLLDSLVAEILLTQAARKERITISESDVEKLQENYRKMYEQQYNKTLTEADFRVLIEKAGFTWDTFTRELRKGLLARKYVMTKKGSDLEKIPQPTDKEVEDYYFSNQSKFVSPEMVRFKQIYINPNILSTQAEKDAARKKAQTIVQEIKAGASFDNYWEVFDATGRTKIGSYMPGILRRDDAATKNAYGPELFDTIFTLRANQVSELITSKVGFHIVMVLEKIPFKVLSLDDLIPPQNAMTVRIYVKSMLSQLKEQETVQKVLSDLVTELKRQAEIKIF